jgi:hypothetical protein
MKNRTIILAILLAAMSGPALSASPREVLELLAKCAEIKDSTGRLACYDQLAPQMRETLAASKKLGERTAEDKVSIFGFDVGGIFGSSEGPTTPEEFGKNQMPPTEAEEAQVLESISAGVTEYARTPFGKFIVFLDNGQVWRQLDSDTGVIHFSHDATENKVVISRGILDSYNLKLDDHNQIYKVKRLK